MTSSDLRLPYPSYTPLTRPCDLSTRRDTNGNCHPGVTAIVPTRRGRHSGITQEQRDQTRRLKKQNMERRRRACISDKMNALYNLAMEVIGLEPESQPRTEKADLLSSCHHVFEGIARIANDNPELQARLHSLRDQFHPTTTTTSPTRQTPDSMGDENTQSSTEFDLVIEQVRPTNENRQLQASSSSSSSSLAQQHDWRTGPLKPHKRWTPSDLDVPTSIRLQSPWHVTSDLGDSCDSGLGTPSDPRYTAPHMVGTCSSDFTPSQCYRPPLASRTNLPSFVTTTKNEAVETSKIWRPYI